MTNLLRRIGTKFYQNRSRFVEEMTKTFGVFFSVHSVDSRYTKIFPMCIIIKTQTVWINLTISI